jgi:transposase
MKGLGEMFAVKDLRNQGKSVSVIARELGIDRKTVRKLAAATAAPTRRSGPPGPKKLDPYVGYLEERLAAGMTNGAVLEREIRSQGYAGGHSILRAWLHERRPARAEAGPIPRFETLPGQQAQVDWADCGPVLLDGCPGRLMAFVLVLGYSRMAYVEFSVGRDVGRLLRAHQHAFDALGGVPRTVLYDNERTITGGRDHDGQPRWQATFADFAATYGFVPKLCAPYRAQTKGKVERFISYLRGNFLADQHAATLDQLNAKVQTWLATVANVRVHATTGMRPIDRWLEETLGAVNGRTYDTSVWSERRVSRDGFVSYLANRYSVPWTLSGRVVRVQETPSGEVRIWRGLTLMTQHDLRLDRGRVMLLPEHVTRPQPLPSPGYLRLVQAPMVPTRSLLAYQEIAEAEG